MKNIKHQTNHFRSKIPNENDIDVETAKFWYEEAEKALKSTQDVINALHDRAYRIMTFSGISAASIFSFIAFFKAGSVSLSLFFLIPAIATLILYAVVFVFCFYATKQDFISQIGMSPEKSMKANFIKPNDPRQFVNILLAATESYQDAIENNLTIIDKKSTWINRCFKIFSTIPVIIGLTFLIQWIWTTFSHYCPL